MIVLERKSAYLFMGAGFVVLLGILVATMVGSQGEILHVHIPFHASLEAVGGIIAILVAVILFAEEAVVPMVSFQIPALGIMGMGIFDLFHSASLLGDSFVWLRSFSCLIGGVGYALTWLPATVLNVRRQPWLLGAVAVILSVVGGVGALSHHLPPALINDHFSALAAEVNILAAILFTLGSVRLLTAFHQSRRVEYYLLAWFGLLNGASGFELPLSRPWDMTWWLWHGLRFLGMVIAGFLLVYRQLETGKGLSRALADLQRANLTIQEQAEAELRAREMEFTKVANILPGPVARVNLEGCYLFANAAFARWFGKPPDEVVGRTQAEVLGEELYRRVQPNIQRALAGEMMIYEIAVTSSAGEPLYGQVTLLPELDLGGNPRGHFTIVTDITELRRSEESLRASQAALRKSNRTYALLSAVNQTIVRQREPLAIFAEACRIAVEIGGFRMAWVGMPDAGGTCIKPVAQAGDAQDYLAQLAITLDDTPRGHGPTAMALGRGEHVVANDIARDPCMAPWREAALARGYLASAAFPVMLDGQVAATLNLYSGERSFFTAEELQLLDGLAADIAFALEVSDRETKRLVAEEALRRAARNWETTFSAITDAICLLDCEQKIVNANRAMLDLCGKTLAEIVGRPYSTVICGPEGSVPQSTLALVLSNKKRASQELTFQERAFEVIADPILDRKGDIVGLVHTMRDVTEQKLLGEQLQRAQRLESVGRLAGGVAHDLNNMLGVILGYTQLALQSADTPAGLRDDLSEVQKAAQHSVEVTRQLLTFASRQVVSPQILDLNLALGNMLKLLRRLLGEDVRLEWRPAADLWPVKVDPAQLEQVLANLAVNARDAMVHGGALTITTANVRLDDSDCLRRPEATPGDYCLLTVSDTGTGMDEATLARIFEPFFTTKETGQGTGLGLATVYGIVRQGLGFIEVDSHPGRGTTFAIHLPRIQGVVGPKGHLVARPEATSGSETILLVEDEEAVLVMCRRFLDTHGYTVLTATSPSRALELATSHPGPLHLLITDLVMPEMNGMELREKISALRSGIKTILMSGHPGDVLSQKELGEANFIGKPFGEQEFNALIRETLARG